MCVIPGVDVDERETCRHWSSEKKRETKDLSEGFNKHIYMHTLKKKGTLYLQQAERKDEAERSNFIIPFQSFTK